MSVAYFDTSALLKRYVTEIGSGWVNAVLAAADAPAVFTSHLALVETTCAFARRLRDKTITVSAHAQSVAAFDYDVTYRYKVVDVMPQTIDAARQLASRHPLRAYDAMHLATACLLNQEVLETGKSPLIFVSADDRLLAIAQAESLPTDNPNHHP